MNASIDKALSQLQQQLADLPCPERAADPLRITIPIDSLNPLEWLASISGPTRYYWADRENHFEMAGIAEAAVIVPDEEAASAFVRIRRELPNHPDARFYGGFRFRPGNNRPGRWRAFADYRFILPRIECCRFGDRASLAVNLSGDSSPAERNQAIELIRSLQSSPNPAAPPAFPAVIQREDRPDYLGWTEGIRRALTAFDQDLLRKVVLARETTFTATAPFDAVAVLRQLALNTNQSFLFCFHPAPDRAFLGASPERLFRREGRQVSSEAIAGTRPRAADPAADESLRRALLSSEKDRREQALVVEAIRRHLAPLCTEMNGDSAPETLELTHCRHLISRISGRLHPEITDEDLLVRLHPTPAVGGSPTETALQWIDREEPFDRGIYAGPVGWVAADAAEFCVALRSGLVQGSYLSVYNGAGIVPGSDPDEEWAEIETKMMSFLRVVGLAPKYEG